MDKNYYTKYLAHHGIKGQKWGVKNGPPYPLDPEDHNASEKKAGWKQSLGKDGSTSVKVEQKKNRVTKTSNKKPKSDGKEKSSQKKDVAKQKISKINKSKAIKTAEKAVVFSLLPRTKEQKDLMSMSWQAKRAHDLVEWGHWYVETYIKK